MWKEKKVWGGERKDGKRRGCKKMEKTVYIHLEQSIPINSNINLLSLPLSLKYVVCSGFHLLYERLRKLCLLILLEFSLELSHKGGLLLLGLEAAMSELG
eukprot:m.21534 g.21534  ORF g.21534 m.21534 type:complete len:100 (+) comp5358_c0_seq1:165-464(+)